VHEAIEGLSYALGPCAVMQYLLQGMFHPARKVRNVYWRIYNNMYVSQQDALVAMYPQLQDEAERTYRRHELDLFI
jgi:splicing factor 3B subunit 1